MNTPIKNTRHALIRICKKVLCVDIPVTEHHVSLLKLRMTEHINDGMSPAEIKKLYGIEYTDFGMFLKKCLGLTLLTKKDAVNNFYKKVGKSVTDEKLLYRKACEFSFDPYSLPHIPGYDKLLESGIYHPVKNPDGVCRDHMVSVAYGWRNKIDPTIISHPCNCQFLPNYDNLVKNDKSCLQIDELILRIQTMDMSPVRNESKTLLKSDSHKKKISEKNSQYMTITNGVVNCRILKSHPIPNNFWRGMTRKNKMVGMEGLEPTLR